MGETSVLDQEEITRQLFRHVITTWVNRDLEGTLKCMRGDIVHMLNVTGASLPFAPTSQGKPKLRKKLELMRDTFSFDAYVTDHLTVHGNVVRARMKSIYTHFETGQRLQTNFRFVVRQEEGLWTRIEEYHDAAYLEAFFRLVAERQRV